MKKVTFIILLMFIYQGCLSQKVKYRTAEGTLVLKGYFFKIDTLKNFYTYHFKSDSIEGIFTKSIGQNFNNPNFKDIKLHKKYTLILNKQLYAGSMNFNNLKESIYEDNILIWKTGMKSQYFTDCENIKGGKINQNFTLSKD